MPIASYGGSVKSIAIAITAGVCALFLLSATLMGTQYRLGNRSLARALLVAFLTLLTTMLGCTLLTLVWFDLFG